MRDEDEKRAVALLFIFAVTVVLLLVNGPEVASILLEALSYLP